VGKEKMKKGHYLLDSRIWELPYKEIEALGLNSRIVDDEK